MIICLFSNFFFSHTYKSPFLPVTQETYHLLPFPSGRWVDTPTHAFFQMIARYARHKTKALSPVQSDSTPPFGLVRKSNRTAKSIALHMFHPPSNQPFSSPTRGKPPLSLEGDGHSTSDHKTTNQKTTYDNKSKRRSRPPRTSRRH